MKSLKIITKAHKNQKNPEQENYTKETKKKKKDREEGVGKNSNSLSLEHVVGVLQEGCNGLDIISGISARMVCQTYGLRVGRLSPRAQRLKKTISLELSISLENFNLASNVQLDLQNSPQK